MFSNLRGSEWLILILVLVLLFGARRLPDAARGLGRSLRIFKAETKGLTDSSDDKSQDAKAVDAPTATQPDPSPVTDKTTATGEAGKQTPTQP
ncbi:MAG: Sec-independent protein translocase subunit TatA [Candidatus Nanopelagicales bacterium]